MIRMLDDAIINRIAAGEVVERPSSVLKELVENALDAGARHLSVALRQGGVGLIQVADDGVGMSRDDAMMSIERHATSKLTQVEDLDQLVTMGFRGEALASIASVSRFELLTRLRGADSGVRLRLEGGRLDSVAEAGAPEGTRITVRDLFFNVPARRKFLRTEPTELQHCEDALKRVLLIRPEVSAELLVDGRPRLVADRVDDRLSRAHALLGGAARGLFAWQDQRGDYEIDALLSPIGEHTAANQAQLYLYVNGRFVRDGLLRRAVTEAYQAIIPRFRAPTVVLELRLPPQDVDVNVHPAKTEVRFREGRNVVERVGLSIQAALSQGGQRVGLPALGATWGSSANAGQQQTLTLQQEPPPAACSAQSHAHQPVSDAQHIEYAPTPAETQATPIEGSPQRAAAPSHHSLEVAHRIDLQPHRIGAREQHPGGSAGAARPAKPIADARPSWAVAPVPSTFAEPVGPVSPAPAPALSNGRLRYQDLRVLGQIAERYVVAEAPAGLVIIDQHAIGTRLVREQLRLAAAQGRPGRPLLSPRVLELGPAAMGRWSRLDDALRTLGVELEPFGAGSLILKQLPLALSGVDPEALMVGLLADEPAATVEPAALIEPLARLAVPTTQARSVYELREVFKRYDATFGDEPGADGENSAVVGQSALAKLLRGPPA